MAHKNEFFRDMSLLICSNLDIEKALVECHRYLGDFLPLKSLVLHAYDFQDRKGGALARVGQGGRAIESFSINEPLKARWAKFLPRFWRQFDGIRVLNRPGKDEFSAGIYSLICEYLPDAAERSFLLMRLEPSGKRVGTLTLSADGYDRYTKGHADLMSILAKPFSLAVSNAIRHYELRLRNEKLAKENRSLHRELATPGKIIGKDSGLRQVMEKVRQVAPSENPVLIQGETGTGKGLLAKAIQQAGSRSNGPFVRVNCGAVPMGQMDTELFGHKEGTFTRHLGAGQGHFRRAHGGTIFLDEIGDLPMSSQVRLIHLIKYGEMEGRGRKGPVKIDTRIIAATHRDLAQRVKDGAFSEDLWFRINVSLIFIPPLRQRREDIPPMAEFFVEKKSAELNVPVPRIEQGSLKRLENFPWPGNVRELENVVERAMIRHGHGLLRIDPGMHYKGAGVGPAVFRKNRFLSLDDAMAAHIKSVLKHTQGRISGLQGAANILRMHPNTLRNRMDRLGIPFRKGG